MTSHEERRKDRINKIMSSVKSINDEGRGVSKTKLIAQCCIEFGASDRKVKEYINQLIRGNYLEIRDDGLLWNLAK